MRKLFKTAAAVITVLSMLTCVAPGFAEQEQEMFDNGMTYGSGYPITKEPITLKMLVNSGGSLRPNLDTTSVWDYIEEKTNIRVEVQIAKDADQVSLMFASRDYPDFAANIGSTDQQRADAAEAGDLVMIDDMLEQFAPTWRKFLDENQLAYKASLGADGKLYTLPFCDFADSDRLLRDQWFINSEWLDELGLKAPSTIEEFTAVLQAFKDNAGQGSIPENAIPFYFLYDSYIGGQFDIYGSFGIPVTDANYLAVEDGKVVFQGVNPAIKEPLKYLQQLYQAGLILPDSFTDDWNMYITKTSSNPGVVGSYGAFANRLTTSFSPMAPLDSGNGEKPIIRRQTYTPGPAHCFMIFSNNPYPAATLRLAEFVVDDVEHTETVMRGRQGIFWDYTEDGKVQDLLWESDPAGMTENAGDMGLWNSFIGIRADGFYSNYYNKDLEDPTSRAWAFENIYKNYLPEGEVNYVAGSLDSESTTIMNQYAADINDLRKTTFANWITGTADIDAEWDAYVAKVEALELEDYLNYRQQAYDKVMK